MATFTGTSGDDTITPTLVSAGAVAAGASAPTAGAADTLSGGAGNDTLDGGGGGDSILAGDGNDLINFAPTDLSDSLTVNGGNGKDQLNVTAPDDGAAWDFSFHTAAGHGEAALTQLTHAINIDSVSVEDIQLDATHLGSAQFTLTSGPQTIVALQLGTQVIVEGAGFPAVLLNNLASATPLAITTGDGNDNIDVTRLAGAKGAIPHTQTIDSGADNDTISATNSTVFAGTGDDVINWTRAGADTIDGGAGNDIQNIATGGNTDTITLGTNGAFAISGAHVLESLNGQAQDVVGVETINIAVGDRADKITIGDLVATDVHTININLAGSLGGPDGAVDTVNLSANAGVQIAVTHGADGTSEQITYSASGLVIETFNITGLDATDVVTVTQAPPPVGGALFIGTDNSDEIAPSRVSGGVLAAGAAVPGAENDTIIGGGGDDQLFGGDGADSIDGGAGDDFLGANGNGSTLIGGAGNDGLIVAGNSTASGGDGNDSVETFGSGSTLLGGAGNDVLLVDHHATNALVSGGDGDDEIESDAGHATITGDAGNDLIFLFGGPSSVSGGDGNDTIESLDFAGTTLQGGAGDDHFQYTFAPGLAPGLTVIDGGSGSDSIDFQNGFEGAPGFSPFIPWQQVLGGDGAGGADLHVIFRIFGTADVDLTSVDSVSLQGGEGSDQFVVNDLTGTGVSLVTIDEGVDGVPDASADITELSGSASADHVVARDLANGDLDITGLPAEVRVLHQDHVVSGGDAVTLFAGAGNDLIDLSQQNLNIGLFLDGGFGDDTIIAGFSNVTFNFDNGLKGDDVIIGFDVQSQVIDVTGLTKDSDLLHLERDGHIFDSSAGVVISDGLGSFLTLAGVHLNQLSGSNFLFALPEAGPGF